LGDYYSSPEELPKEGVKEIGNSYWITFFIKPEIGLLELFFWLTIPGNLVILWPFFLEKGF